MKTAVRDFIAKCLSRFLRRFASDPRYHDLWQANGYHVKQVHFYSPLPDTRQLGDEVFSRISTMPGLEFNESGQLEILEEFECRYRGEYEKFRDVKPPGLPQFFFGNSSFESVDAEILYSFIRKFRPKHFVEVGSGFTTLLAGSALARNRKEGVAATMTAIEPYPASFLSEELPYPVDLLVQPVQEVPLEFFTRLECGDILFIDSSHVCKIGSDVQYEFLEILPRLAPGVIVHIHDIFLPKDYPARWVKDEHWFWNEQYLLQAFLCGNRDLEVLWAGAWMHLNHPDKLAAAFPSYNHERIMPASFWIRSCRA